MVTYLDPGKRSSDKLKASYQTTRQCCDIEDFFGYWYIILRKCKQHGI